MNNLLKMSSTVPAPELLSGNIGAKTINVGVKGDDGATFVPSVSADGVISWTNDKDLPNPEPVNIKGEKGEKGNPGADGYTPVKGVDYFDGADGISATHSWNGTTLTITSASGSSSADLKGEKGDKGDNGTTNYFELENKPSINGVELLGNKTGEELGLVPDLSGYATKEELPVVPDLSGFATKDEIPVVPEALPNPNALTFTGAVNATYDGSQAVSVEIPSDEHINSLIDEKLGVIENGSY